jgi:hypothetical protein
VKQDIRPFVPDGLTGHYNTMAAGDKLYAFCNHGLPLYYLRDARAHPESGDLDTDESESKSAAHNYEPESYDSDEEHLNTWRGRAEERWAWKRSPVSIPCGATGGALVKGRTFYVTAGQAVHPDGRTIFLSTCDEHRPSKEFTSTFSLDTGRPGAEWTRLGDWHLPFMSKASYDRDMDAWVGIEHCEDTNSHHLCSCDLPSAGEDPTPQPAWRLCKERLTFMQAPLRSMCRTLVHTGRGRFCLVEVAPPPGGARRCVDVDQDHLLQLTMFRASYGKNGELMATPLRPGRLYRMFSYDALGINQPPAFWM